MITVLRDPGSGYPTSGHRGEVLREGKANLKDSYALLKNSEVFLLNCHISPYSTGIL